MRQDPWQILGIARDAGVDEIRRAYVGLLKRNRPDEDPQAFQRLRDAYEFLLAHAARVSAAATQVSDEVPPEETSAAEPPTPVEGAEDSEPATEVARPPDTVAREILDACTPAQFEPEAVRRLVNGLPDLVPMHMRYSTGVALAYCIANGVAISPHAILLLSSLFDWDDIAIVRTHPIFNDPRFVERVQRAHEGSRPSTRQHTTSPNVGVGIFVVLAIAASNVSRELGGRKSNGGLPMQIRGEGDVVLICLLGLVALGLIGNEARTHGKQLSVAGRRWRWGARIVLGSVLLMGVLYFIGRP